MTNAAQPSPEHAPENPRAVIGGNMPPFSLKDAIDQLDESLAADHGALAQSIDGVAARANVFLPKTDNNPNGGRIIEGPADIEVAKQIVIDAKKISKTVGAAHKDEKQPWLDGSRKVDAYFRQHDERIDRITRYIDGCIRKYQDKVEQIERERRAAEAERLRKEEERQRELARKAEEDGRTTAAAKAEQRAENAAAKADEAAAAVSQARDSRTAGDAFSGISSSSEWTFEITDRNAIDLNKLSPWISLADIEKALRGYVRANKGTAPLAGVRIFERAKNSYRG